MNQTVNGTTKQPRKPGWWYPYIFVAGFAVVVGVNGIMFYYASSTFTGLTTTQAFEDGLAYNKTLAAAEIQRQRGWQVEFGVEASPPTSAEQQSRFAEVSATFLDRDGQPLSDLTVNALLFRPTAEGYDVSRVLTHVGEGRYVAPVELPLYGQWELRLIGSRGEEQHQLVTRVIVR
ncbi:FixH family protein [Telmatospirillum sp. J64-1]|uniref:FixH family protein n=1 Tax=Telmatospirillum sp. J64-1 TaxID=2502183 RepID=UPI00115CFE35|nr:FixH family protein [Telmatospirillum sp. J64-1]